MERMNMYRQMLLLGLLFCLNYTFSSQKSVYEVATDKVVDSSIETGISLTGHVIKKGIDYKLGEAGYITPAEQAQIDFHEAQTRVSNESFKVGQIDVLLKRVELFKLEGSLTGKENTEEYKLKRKQYEKLMSVMTTAKENIVYEKDEEDDYLPKLTPEEIEEALNPKKAPKPDAEKTPGMFSKAFAPVAAAAGYVGTGVDYLADHSFGYFIESRRLNRFLVCSTICIASYYIYKKLIKKKQDDFDLFAEDN
jgi:hypothetical protein